MADRRSSTIFDRQARRGRSFTSKGRSARPHRHQGRAGPAPISPDYAVVLCARPTTSAWTTAVQGELHCRPALMSGDAFVYHRPGETHRGNSSLGDQQDRQDRLVVNKGSSRFGRSARDRRRRGVLRNARSYLKAVDARRARSCTVQDPVRHYRQRHDYEQGGRRRGRAVRRGRLGRTSLARADDPEGAAECRALRAGSGGPCIGSAAKTWTPPASRVGGYAALTITRRSVNFDRFALPQ